MRLVGKPEAAGTLIAAMPDAVSAGRAVSAIVHKGFRPRALELVDRLTLEHVRPKAHYKFPADAGAVLLVDIDGDADAVEGVVLQAGELCEAQGAREVVVARDEADRERLWQTRRVCSQSLKAAYAYKMSEDIVVPPARIPEILRRIDKTSAEHNIAMATFGHAGDGNLHVNLCTEEDERDPAVRKRIDNAVEDLFHQTLDLGGTLSGEHGIGIAKARYMAWEQQPAVIEWQKRLKRLWDPANLLNPGKIFDWS
jgi:glycolate oxidase